MTKTIKPPAPTSLTTLRKSIRTWAHVEANMGIFRAANMSMVSLGIIALFHIVPVQAQVPPAPVFPEHHYPPGSRTVHTTYTCMDGSRSITIQYAHFSKAKFASLSRNGYLASPDVLKKINAALEQFTAVKSINPECGSNDDTLIIEGLKGRTGAMIMMKWSLTEVQVYPSS